MTTDDYIYSNNSNTVYCVKTAQPIKYDLPDNVLAALKEQAKIELNEWISLNKWERK